MTFAVLALGRPFVPLWRAPSVATTRWVAIVTFAVVENIMESFVLWRSYIWVLLVASAFTRAPNATRVESVPGMTNPPKKT